MREIKFQFLYKGLPFSGANEGFNWHKKVYSLDQLIEKPLSQLSDAHGQSELIAKRQYTGLKDKNGKEIYEGDLIELHKNKNGCCQVVFENSYVGGWVLTEPKNKGSRLSLGARDPSDIEVIGTTYENPDLIGDI